MNVIYFLTPKSKIRCCYDTMSVRQALEIFEHYRYQCVPLINESGFYIGTLSEGDLLFYIKEHPFKSQEDFNKIKILDVKRNRDYLPINAFVEIDDIITTSTNQNFVPILDDKEHFIGIVTRKTIINYLFLNSKKDVSL